MIAGIRDFDMNYNFSVSSLTLT